MFRATLPTALFISASLSGADSPRDPPEPVLHLRDGAIITGAIRFERLRVITRYGLLEIPAGELFQVRVAPRDDPEVLGRIDSAIGRLGSADIDAREEATAVLRELGARARERLRGATRSTDEEVKARAGIILAEIEASSAPQESEAAEGESPDPLPEGSEDEVVARRFTIRGRIDLDSLQVTTRYGALDVSLADIEAIVFRGEGPSEASLAVGPESTLPEKWLRTKVSVQRGDRLDIRASGQMTVQGYNILSGPEGNTRYSSGASREFPVLALVAKVGKGGKPFLVGREHTGKAARGGELYLGVVPFRQNRPMTGSYRVKVEVRP